MAVKFQLVIDCTDPGRLCSFWTAALGYELEPVPAGFATWDDYWRDVGVPEEELGGGPDRIRDPDGAGPAIWFQVVPEGSWNGAITSPSPARPASASASTMINF